MSTNGVGIISSRANLLPGTAVVGLRGHRAGSSSSQFRPIIVRIAIAIMCESALARLSTFGDARRTCFVARLFLVITAAGSTCFATRLRIPMLFGACGRLDWRQNDRLCRAVSGACCHSGRRRNATDQRNSCQWQSQLNTRVITWLVADRVRIEGKRCSVQLLV